MGCGWVLVWGGGRRERGTAPSLARSRHPLHPSLTRHRRQVRPPRLDARVAQRNAERGALEHEQHHGKQRKAHPAALPLHGRRRRRRRRRQLPPAALLQQRVVVMLRVPVGLDLHGRVGHVVAAADGGRHPSPRASDPPPPAPPRSSPGGADAGHATGGRAGEFQGGDGAAQAARAGPGRRAEAAGVQHWREGVRREGLKGGEDARTLRVPGHWRRRRSVGAVRCRVAFGPWGGPPRALVPSALLHHTRVQASTPVQQRMRTLRQQPQRPPVRASPLAAALQRPAARCRPRVGRQLLHLHYCAINVRLRAAAGGMHVINQREPSTNGAPSRRADGASCPPPPLPARACNTPGAGANP